MTKKIAFFILFLGFILNSINLFSQVQPNSEPNNLLNNGDSIKTVQSSDFDTLRVYAMNFYTNTVYSYSEVDLMKNDLKIDIKPSEEKCYIKAIKLIDLKDTLSASKDYSKVDLRLVLLATIDNNKYVLGFDYGNYMTVNGYILPRNEIVLEKIKKCLPGYISKTIEIE